MLKSNEAFIILNDKLKETYYKYFISTEKTIRKQFKKRLGREVNLNNPTKFNDKLQWLKLHWYDPLGTKCADKFEVREYVREKIGEQYLNELYGVYNSVDEIDISHLPKSFVLKATHASGFNIICEDKNKMDWQQEIKKMRRWLRTNYYWSKREWVYRDIKPRIVCEKYLSDETGKPPMDYKFFCFHGSPLLIQVDVDRFGNHQRNFYDIEWNFRDIQIEEPSNKNIKVNKPKKLEEMLDLSKKLSQAFPHVRVDFYNLEDRILFGELTFFHHSGMGRFSPAEFEEEMGKYIKLPIPTKE